MKKITIPQEMSPELAEEIGIHIGDGSLVIRPDSGHYEYYVCLSKEEEGYAEYVCSLMSSLYSIEGKTSGSSRDESLRVLFSSKALAFWKLQLGLPSGDKGQISIPKPVLDSSFVLDCIRGIFDTDGTLMFKRKQRGVHSYPVIKITSKSRVLISQLFGIVSKVGFTCHTYYDEEKISSSGKKV